MRTTSIGNSLNIAFFGLYAFSSYLSAATLEVHFPDGAYLEFSPRSSKLTGSLSYRGNTETVFIESSLREQLRSADEVFVLTRWTFSLDGAPAFAAMVRVPSSPSDPEGYCGAGHEDYLLLLSYDRSNLRLLDKVIIQSCLQSISLVSDKGDDPREAVISSIYPEIAHFRSMAPPDLNIRAKKVIVTNGQLSIVDIKD